MVFKSRLDSIKALIFLFEVNVNRLTDGIRKAASWFMLFAGDTVISRQDKELMEEKIDQ